MSREPGGDIEEYCCWTEYVLLVPITYCQNCTFSEEYMSCEEKYVVGMIEQPDDTVAPLGGEVLQDPIPSTPPRTVPPPAGENFLQQVGEGVTNEPAGPQIGEIAPQVTPPTEEEGTGPKGLGESVFPGETGVLEEPATPKIQIPPKIEIPPLTPVVPRTADEGTGPPPEPLPACPEGQVLDEVSGLCVPEEPVAEEPQAEDEELQQESSEEGDGSNGSNNEDNNN